MIGQEAGDEDGAFTIVGQARVALADVDFKLIHFATPAEAEPMQRWIAASGIHR